MADIFLSYASEDRDRVRPLVQVFEAQGWSVWWDRAIHAGPRFDDEIEHALDEARCVVVVWSQYAVKKVWVRNEASEGLKRGILVPVAIDVVTLPLEFRQNQTAQMSRWPGASGELDNLVAGVRALISGDRPAVEPMLPKVGGIRQSKWMKWTAGALIALAAAAVVFVFVSRYLPGVRENTAPRTAVFMFATPAADAGAADLAAGIRNQVIETMGVMGLPVVSRSSIDALTSAERVSRSVRLGAEFSLDGEIRRDATNLVVTGRIESLSANTTIWVSSFRGTDANALQIQIANQLTDSLACAVDNVASPGIGNAGIRRDDADSLSMLLRGCSQFRANGDAAALFRTLVARYPDSARLNAYLAYAIAISLTAAPPTARAALIDEAKAAATRALALDPQQPFAYVAQYTIGLWAGLLPAGKLEALFIDGLRLSPDDALLNAQYGQFLQWTGRIAAAEPYFRRAVSADPLSPAKAPMLAINLASTERFAESERLLSATAIRWPNKSGIWQARMHLAVFAGAGDVDELIAAAPVAVRTPEWTACWRALAAARSQSDSERRPRMATAATQQCVSTKVIDDGEAVSIAAALGNVDEAFARAERAPGWPYSEGVGPFDWEARAMQRDIRFMPLMQRLGFVDGWTEQHYLPDFCSLPGLPYDCRTYIGRSARNTNKVPATKSAPPT